jgi:hypothetical protein
MGYEYAIFNKLIKAQSITKKIAEVVAPHYKLDLNPTPGYPMSYFLGWLGFGVMLLMNFYILRKRMSIFSKLGKLPGWLEFHIFCGILGPIFIIFHTNFKIDGLVAISFWSMMISSSSGIVGRYFYIQTLKKKEDILKSINSSREIFIKKHQNRIPEEKIEVIFQHAYSMAGVSEDITNPFLVFASSLKADINLMFTNPGKAFGLSEVDGDFLKKLGVDKRRATLIEPFKQLLGYWHAFHLPFAFFMYIIAIVHIVAALLFGVKH